MELSYFAVLLLVASAAGNPLQGAVGPHNFNNTSLFTRVIPSRNVSLHDAVYVTPTLLFVGKTNGDIHRCLFESPSVCEMFYSHSTSHAVTAMVAHGEYLYVSLSNLMLRCDLHKKHSCTTFNTVSANQVLCLTISAGYIHGGLSDGRMVRCELHQPNSCKTFNTFTQGVTSLGATEKYMYAGLTSGEIWRCSIGSENSCRLIHTSPEGPSIGMSAVDETVLAVVRGGYYWNCTRDSQCNKTTIPGAGYTSMVDFDGVLYGLMSGGTIYKCMWDMSSYSSFEQYQSAQSIAVAYSTYKMQDRFVNEDKTCVSGGQCPPFVVYYEVNQRPMLEVSVRRGKLYNSQGVLVDTRGADAGRGIFALGPDGQLLVSTVHNSILRSSSLFAGQPVAGAGEIAIEDGVIRAVRACSDHYRPDAELNKQLAQALRAKGYTSRIDSQPCDESGQVDEQELTTFQII